MKINHPDIIYPNSSIVGLYDTLWALSERTLIDNTHSFDEFDLFFHPEDTTINQFDTIMSTFFLVYGDINVPQQLDFFYARQESDGAIRSDYSIKDGNSVHTSSNPEGVGAPLFSWAEHNLYHKLDDKKRVRTVAPILEKYWQWLEHNFFDTTNGLYAVPFVAGGMQNSPRKGAKYPIDFNIQQAINASYMAKIGRIINDKDISFRYRKKYFSLRNQINNLMWDTEAQFYFDLNADGKRIPKKSIAAFWALLAQLPNEAKLVGLVDHLENPDEFAQQNVFPTLAKNEPEYSSKGEGYLGSVFSPYTYMIIKGLEKYSAYRSAKKYSLQHITAIIETINARPEKEGDARIVEAYQAEKYEAARWSRHTHFPRKQYVPYVGLAGIALLIENVIGLKFSLPRKTVELTMTNIESMGIKNVSLKRNSISIICDKTHRGWEVHLTSEKLYYFTIHILNNKKKTLPIPSGKCSPLIEKI